MIDSSSRSCSLRCIMKWLLAIILLAFTGCAVSYERTNEGRKITATPLSAMEYKEIIRAIE